MKIVASFETITPVFCAGANQNGPSEIRIFAIKGMLRWFYRALDARCDLAREGQVFGSSAGTGVASPVIIRLDGTLTGNRSYQQQLKPRKKGDDGERYLGYSLYLGPNARLAIDPGKRFQLTLSARWGELSDSIRKAWLSALWLFGHLGGLGSRVRRGFGTVALVGLEGDPEKLPLPHQASSIDEWRERFKQGYSKIRGWFQERQSDSVQPALPKNLNLLIGPAQPDWVLALRNIGNLMQNFRATEVKPKYPALAAFGLPLRSDSRHDSIIPSNREYNRLPSRLWIRVLKVGESYYPMVWVMHASLVPDNKIKWQKSDDGLMVPQSLGVIKDFLAYLRGKGYS